MKKVVSLIALVSASSFAWDGQREGFLLGIGAGVASASTVLDQGSISSYQWLAPMTTSRIGYAWSNTDAIELYSNSIAPLNTGSYGYTGVNYHWWNSPEIQANSWFGGLGLLTESTGITYDEIDSRPANIGFGINIGYGREIASHASIELNLTAGAVVDDRYYLDDSDHWRKNTESNTNAFAALSISVGLLGY